MHKECNDDNKLNTILHMQELSCAKLKLSWPEQIILGDSGQVVVLGFHSTSFVAYSLQENAILCEILCGGSHRSWAYAFSGINRNDFVLTFIKDKKVVQRTTLSIGEKLFLSVPCRNCPGRDQVVEMCERD